MQTDDRAYDPELPWRTAESSAGQATRRLPTDPILPTATRRRPGFLALALIGVGLFLLLGRVFALFQGPGMPGMPAIPMMPDMPPMPGMPMFRSPLAALAEQMVPGMILLTIAASFMFFAFWRRWYPFLIPGSILTGLGLGIMFVELTSGASVLWGLAFGFFLIYWLGSTLFRVHAPWPIFPAVPLFAIGCIVIIANLPSFLAMSGSALWLPLLLLGGGAYLAWGQRR